jgi:FkbM family methyltransferase
MKIEIIRIIQSFTIKLINLLYRINFGRLIVDTISSSAMERKVKVVYKTHTFLFTSPNYLNHWRLKTFSSKEPETLDWIDNLEEGALLWDIGANVGLYSIYAAKVKKCKVYSFEPSVFNLELLARNAFINDLSTNIFIVPLPLSMEIGINKLNMSSTSWGGAISTFGNNAIGHDGKPMNKVFDFSTLGITMDYAVDFLNIPKPDYIKMDVDGIEHFILMGGEKVLNNVKGVIIEINDDFIDQGATASRLLIASGLKLKEKVHSELVENIEEFNKTFNQIWVRKN